MASLQSARPSSEINQNSGQVQVRGDILNKGKGTLTKHDERHWKGHGNFPPEIKVNQAVKFVHRGANGSEAGVIYRGPNIEHGPDNSEWVLAFEAPGDGSPNKVYVETRGIEKYPVHDETHWIRIRAQLKISSNKSFYVDPVTGARASATITSDIKNPQVSAVFDVDDGKVGKVE